MIVAVVDVAVGEVGGIEVVDAENCGDLRVRAPDHDRSATLAEHGLVVAEGGGHVWLPVAWLEEAARHALPPSVDVVRGRCRSAA